MIPHRTIISAVLLGTSVHASAQPDGATIAEPLTTPPAGEPAGEPGVTDEPGTEPSPLLDDTDAELSLRQMPDFPIIRYTPSGVIGYRSDAGLDGPGSFAVTTVASSIDVAIVTSPTLTLSAGFTAEYTSYEFDGGDPLLPGVAGSEDPFDQAESYEISLTTIVRTSERVSWLAIGTVASAFEPGADFGDSVSGTVLVGGLYQFSENLRLGAGVIVAFDLDGQPNVIPIPNIDWQIDERWRLSSGRFGLQLMYEQSEQLKLGVGSRFVGREFRLSDDAPVPGGIVEDDSIAIAGILEWTPVQNLNVELAAGAQIVGELILRDANDVRVFDSDIDTAFVGALRVTYSF